MAEQTENKQFFGKYRGFVKDVMDPEELGRVKCSVPAVLGNLLTDWAWPAGSWYGGLEDYGFFMVPELDSSVLVEFEAGDVNRPLYTAVWWGKKGQNHVPKLGRGTKDESAEGKGTDLFISGDFSVHMQPAAAFAGKYPENIVLKTKDEKLVIEIDDTKGAARFHVFHGPSKSFHELDKEGNLSVSIAKKRYTFVGDEDGLHVKGDRHVGVDGADGLFVQGDQNLFLQGNQTSILAGDRTTIILGSDIELVVGTKMTTVLESYVRIAGIAIVDIAGEEILHQPS